MVKEKDIIKRWNERIVPEGWDKMGKDGARLYLIRFGKNIGAEKRIAFANYARTLGLNDFAEEMLQDNIHG